MRIAWQNRFKIPRHPNFSDYTPEEMVLESWEQFLYENPKHLENTGISKKRNPKTGAAYFTCGDPVIDELERLFGEGITPNLNDYLTVKGNAPDIFRSPLFVKKDGEVVVPVTKPENIIVNEKGQTVTENGAKAEQVDFDKVDWDKAMDEDPVLKQLAGKLGVNYGR